MVWLEMLLEMEGDELQTIFYVSSNTSGFTFYAIHKALEANHVLTGLQIGVLSPQSQI